MTGPVRAAASRVRSQAWLVAAVLTTAPAAVLLAAVAFGGAHHTPAGQIPADRGTASGQAPIPVPPVSAAQLAALPAATTDITLPSAPLDPSPSDATAGIVAHNTSDLPAFSAPGGPAFAQLPVTQLGNDTWLPVIDQQPGWVEVLLPSRPNRSAAWLDSSRLQLAHTPYLIRVHLAARTLTLFRDGQQAGAWTVGIGTAATPTPTGRTFLLASVKDTSTSAYSPFVLALGTHSATLDTFGGGPGTVAIHTWPNTDAFGAASSHGCIRVPPDTLHVLQTVPLGTTVLITID